MPCGADDDDCTTGIPYGICGDIAIEGAESHTPGEDDGDCSIAVRCTRCGGTATKAKVHDFVDGQCGNEGCEVWQTFTMTYYADGEEIQTETYTCGTAYWFWTPEEKEGLTFLGWAETEGGEVKYSPTEYIWPEGDMEFHAVYGTVYTVTYYSYNAESKEYYENGSATGMPGEALTLGSDYSYYFKTVGWDADGDGKADYACDEEIILTGNLDLYAVVEPFCAQVELGAEDAVYGRTVICGELPYSSVTLTDFPTRDNYVFTGWMDANGYLYEVSENEEGEKYIEIIFSEDTTLTAQWEVCSHICEEDNFCPVCGRIFITVKPLPDTVEAAIGQKATVTVEAEGENLTYAWYYANPGAEAFLLTNTFTGPTYEVAMSESRNGRQIYCEIRDSNGYVAHSNIVTLSIARNEAQIVTQPKSVWVKEGEKATVTVEATGDGLIYKWYYKNPGASKYTYTSSFKGNVYSVTMSEARSGRYVYCKVTDAYGNTVKSKTVSVNMQTPLEIVTQPKSVKVTEGKKATVTVKAQGDGLTYKWYYKNPGESKYSYTSSFTGNSYSITMNESRDGRYVFCRVYDKYGNMVKTNTVSLRMK